MTNQHDDGSPLAAIDRLLTPDETAAMLAVSIWQLQKWRRPGSEGGPAVTRLGQKLIRYRVSDVQAYIMSASSSVCHGQAA
jgi:hypothetical protein